MENIVRLGIYPGNEVRCVFAVSLPRQPVDMLADEGLEECEGRVSESAPIAPLTDASNSSPPPVLKPGYGGTPRKTMFGLRARRRIIRAGACLDEFVGDGQVLFLTGTLPGGTIAAMSAIANWSSWLVHSLKKWIFKRERAADSLYCWEYQKRGALHLHYAVRLVSESARRFVLGRFKRWWYGAMQNVSARAGCDVFERKDGGTWADRPDKIQADAQVVKKSVGRYLAKYLAKAATGFSSTILPTPVRWFGVSRSLSRRVANQTYEVLLRFSDDRRFREVREHVYSVLETSEGIRWSYRDKCRLAEVQGLYPCSSDELNCIKREFEVVSDMNSQGFVSVYANSAELKRYWSQVRIAFPSMQSFCQRSSPARYQYLVRAMREEGMPSLDFIVLVRWIMSCLAECAHSGAFKRLADADARMSEYLLRVIGIAGDPVKHWDLVASDLRSPVVRTLHAREMVIRKQYRGQPVAAQNTDAS